MLFLLWWLVVVVVVWVVCCGLSLVVGVDSFVEESQLWNVSMLLLMLPFLCGLWQQFYPYFLLSTVRETGVLETLTGFLLIRTDPPTDPLKKAVNRLF